MDLRRIVAASLTVLAAAFIAAGCSRGIPENAICTVNGDAILMSRYKKFIGQAERSYEQQGQKLPKKDSEEYKTIKNQIVNHLIEQQLYAQQAKDYDINVTQKDIDKQLDQLKESLFQGDEKKYLAEVKKQGLKVEDVEENIKETKRNELLFEKVGKDIKATDEEIEEYYKENEDQFKDPEQREVAHILVKKEADAKKIYAQVKGGDEKLFAKIAKEKSQDPSSAQNGGVLTVRRGETVPEFDAMSFKLKTGEISEPVKTQFGYHIIAARGDVSPEKKKSMKEVKDQISTTLEQERRSKRIQEWKTDLVKDAEETTECKKGYVWTQTVSTTEDTGAEPTPEGEAKPPTEDGDKAEGDKAEGETKDAPSADASADGGEESGDAKEEK